MPFRPHPTKSQEIRVHSSGSLIVVEYVSTGTVASLDELLAIELAHAKTHGRISLLQVVTGAMGKVDDATKKKAAEMTTALESVAVGSAVVIPGNTAGAMILRTVVSGINLLSRSRTPTKTMGSVAEALAWLCSLKDQDPALSSVKVAEIESLFSTKSKTAA